MEELLIQRQKRIAERSSVSSSRATSKRIPAEKMSAGTTIKNEKPKIQSPSQETKKPVFRSSTIDRLAAARTTPKVASTQSKPAQPKKATLKANVLSQKSANADNKQTNASKVKSDVLQKKDGTVATIEKPTDLAATQATQPKDGSDDFKDIKELHSIASMEKNEGKLISQRDTLDDKGCNGDPLHMDSSAKLHHLKGDDEGLSKSAPVFCEDRKTSNDHGEYISEMMIHPMPESPNKALNLSSVDIRENGGIIEKLHSPKKSEIEISTPPPEEINPQPIHSRKKWNNDENSPKAAKGFRKLLLFGRKSRTAATN